jgi:hypothetical protein
MGAITATTVAAAVSIAATAGGTTASFIQAGQARRRMQAAQDKAAEAMEDARRTLTRNAYDALSVPIKEYEQQREALQSGLAGVTQTIAEGDQRGVGRGAGIAIGQMAEDLRKGRSDIEKSIFELDKLSAAEEQRLSDEERRLYTTEVEGAQMARAAAENERRLAISQGLQGATETVGQAVSMAPLYAKQGVVKRKAALQDLSLDPSQIQAFANQTQAESPLVQSAFTGRGFDVSQLSNREFRQLEKSFTPAQKFALEKAGYYDATALPDSYSGFFEYGLSGLPKEGE